MSVAETNQNALIELTADIASAYVGNNSVALGDLPGLIKGIFGALTGAFVPVERVSELQAPAVSIKKSISNDYLICLEDGR